MKNKVLTVTVLPEDFDPDFGPLGQYMDSMDCPLARAIKRQGLKTSGVSYQFVYIDGEHFNYDPEIGPWDYDRAFEVFESKQPFTVKLIQK